MPDVVDQGELFPCPVCKQGKVHHFHTSTHVVRRFMPDINTTQEDYKCTHCGSVFLQMQPNYFLLSAFPDEYSYTAEYYKGSIRQPEQWQGVPIVPNKTIDDIEAGRVRVMDNLQPVNAPLVLQKNERALLLLPQVTYSEDRSRKVVDRRGESVSLGYGRRAYYPSQSHTEDVRTELDTGAFCLTNKRYAFIGSGKNVSGQNARILSIEVFQDGFSIARSAKQKIEFFTGFPGALYGNVVKAILAESNEG